ncbi:MAG: hypothetical protein Q4A03_02470 [Rothia sp. (in: high G+C Gram-positive bacteria)]|uniref:hypothetical protein n=1 Tax=Rothia sp. (in: high G+C Gram-positive bacteria) TaxID=1885016 RepID=UPI00270AB1B0|nr:hypothetical protein [Rothia sp. (in: high G+C Gram-positive bacteria)]
MPDYVYGATARKQTTSGSTYKIPARVNAMLRARDARIAELTALNDKLSDALTAAETEVEQKTNELQGLTESYDTLTGINEGLNQALIKMTERAETAEAEKTNLTDVLTEELEAERAKNTKLLAKITELQSNLRRSRRRTEEAREQLETAIATAHRTHEGAAITLSANSVELHGTYKTAPIDDIMNTLNLAFQTFVRGANRADITATSDR